jgi:hypothetical protein
MNNNNQLTGGSGDVNPQYFNIRAFVMSGNDTVTSTGYSLAIDRLRGNGVTVGVIEILKVFFYPVTLASNSSRNYFLSTKSFGTTAPSIADGAIITAVTQVNLQATAVAIELQNNPLVVDLSDAAGHGLLVATDQIFMCASSAGTSSTNACDVKILYRYKNVPITEYIGIVQSQT